MKQFWPRLKQQWTRYQGLITIALVVFIAIFLGRAIYRHWQGIATIHITWVAGAWLAIATGTTLFAFILTGWLWGWILQDFDYPINNIWATQIYLTTNIAKYLPSNLIHLYGRTLAATRMGVPLSVATLSVVLDTLLMMAAGLVLGVMTVPDQGLLLAGLGLGTLLILIHPRVLKLGAEQIRGLSRSLRSKKLFNQPQLFPLQRHPYPWRLLLGELGILILRGLGFAMVVEALMPLEISAIPRLISIFSVGWLLGFISPGIPGGIGVFELTVSQLLTSPGIVAQEQTLSYGFALGIVALYRLMNTLAEALGAGLAWLDSQHSAQPVSPAPAALGKAELTQPKR
ncbi:MAG: hypothetical protein HC934_10715 [Acaryochloridaceae cyanobacterium SU_2_1]|nr:hypothetical protein [Acaryochloridaceae cyanobacterium SU_2_1]